MYIQLELRLSPVTAAAYMNTYEFSQGSTPLLISVPHCGLAIAQEIEARMTPAALEKADTDWHVDRLYDFAPALGASMIRPLSSRYVIDLNRPADDGNLYPGANSTGLCPTSDFAERPLYQAGGEPGPEEVQSRLQTWWQPYHQQVQAEMIRLRSEHGCAVLLDAHSIRSVVPRFFEGQLPDLNVGTAGGDSCAASMLAGVEALLAAQQQYSFVLNQRFKGGYITRAYGDPTAGMHSMQMELSQRNYMLEQVPFTYLSDQAGRLQVLLQAIVEYLIEWARTQAREL